MAQYLNEDKSKHPDYDKWGSLDRNGKYLCGNSHPTARIHSDLFPDDLDDSHQDDHVDFACRKDKKGNHVCLNIRTFSVHSLRTAIKRYQSLPHADNKQVTWDHWDPKNQIGTRSVDGSKTNILYQMKKKAGIQEQLLAFSEHRLIESKLLVGTFAHLADKIGMKKGSPPRSGAVEGAHGWVDPNGVYYDADDLGGHHGTSEAMFKLLSKPPKLWGDEYDAYEQRRVELMKRFKVGMVTIGSGESVGVKFHSAPSVGQQRFIKSLVYVYKYDWLDVVTARTHHCANRISNGFWQATPAQMSSFASDVLKCMALT